MLVYFREVAKELVPANTSTELLGSAWREAEHKALSREPYVSLGAVIAVRNSYAIRQQLKDLGFRWRKTSQTWEYEYRDRTDAEAMIRKLHALPVRIVHNSDRIDQILS